VGWAALVAAVLFPTTSRYSRWLFMLGGRVIPIFLSIVYVVIFFAAAPNGPKGDLFSLSGIVTKFTSSDRLFLLYFEVLTFSLFIGGWLVEDARRRSIPKWLILFALPIQCLFGPLGVLGYGASVMLKKS
jgi:hypothetical protein